MQMIYPYCMKITIMKGSVIFLCASSMYVLLYFGNDGLFVACAPPKVREHFIFFVFKGNEFFMIMCDTHTQQYTQNYVYFNFVISCALICIGFNNVCVLFGCGTMECARRSILKEYNYEFGLMGVNRICAEKAQINLRE